MWVTKFDNSGIQLPILYEIRVRNMRAWIVLLLDTRVGNFGMQTIYLITLLETICTCCTFSTFLAVLQFR